MLKLPPAAQLRAPRDGSPRTLYLAADEPMRITSTGEALVVSRPDGRVLRFPVARVLRVVCNDRAEWSGAALVLCQQRGIVVSWLDGGGAPLGHLAPHLTQPIALGDALEWLAEQPGGIASYDNWLSRRRLAVLKRWAAGRSDAGQPVEPPEWHVAKRNYVYRGDVPVQLPARLEGCCAAYTAWRAAEQAVAPRYFAAGGQVIELAADMARLLWAELNFSSGAIAQAAGGRAEAAAVFERWSQVNAAVDREHWADLQRFATRESRE